MRWEYGSLVAIQTGRATRPIRVVQVNGQLWNEGRLWDTDEGATTPDEMLNMLGDEEWELVSIVTALDGWNDGGDAEPPTHRGRTFVYYLKRARS